MWSDTEHKLYVGICVHNIETSDYDYQRAYVCIVLSKLDSIGGDWIGARGKRAFIGVRAAI